MLPFALSQKVEFKKDFGPKLENLDLDKISRVDEIDFVKKLYPIYKSINTVSKSNLLKNKDLIGFVGAPWTLLVYMINKSSPKKKLIKNFFEDKFMINKILIILEKFLKIHIEQQIKNGATVIQIFDSWAGLLKEKDLPNYVYIPTLNLVNHIRSLNVPTICFPRGIKNYKTFCQIVKPDAVNIDYDINPISISQQIDIPIQGGLDPKILLSNKENLKKEVLKYLNVFKDHPYIFNLGLGVVPETNPDMVKYFVELVKDY
jgi:uroporphyrinogen decarboxylase